MFIKDPAKSKESADQAKSVSLTLMIISFAILSILGILQCFSVIKDIGPFMELFITTVSLYFGRRLDLNSLLNRKGKK